ncbi:MAG: hypothetical protein K2K97_02940 [Muribaculaceae bacterium]|nr:hypothetical protein [Muribaculaceae bacterium]
MSSTSIVLLSILGIVIIVIAMYFSYNNKEIGLRKESEAQRGKIETIRDRMFQIIREQANVSTEYKNAFNEIYPKIIEGRYKNGGMLMKWIQEANPQFDTRLYQTLANSIEVQRTAFTSTQNRMLDIINQRATLIEQMPACWFIQNKSAIEYTPITTTATKNVMASGIDDYTFSFK